MIYCFDIDGTICTLRQNSDYENAEPFENVVEKINELYDSGNKILFMTARGSVSGKDWTEYTKSQLDNWGLKYHELLMNIKPHADVFVDDKAINADGWRNSINKKIGFVAGSFDLIHPGYIKMFQDAKRDACDWLVVGLQKDPTLDRPEKNELVHSLEERQMILSSIKYVDEIWVYDTEESLYNMLKKASIDIRILGTDYLEKYYTGKDLGIPIYFHSRNHSWSATNLRQKIYNKFKERL